MGEVKLDGFICERCEHTWISRFLNLDVEPEKPRVCPKCKSPYWDTPRKNGKVEKEFAEVRKELGEVRKELENETRLFPPRKTAEKEVFNLFPPK